METIVAKRDEYLDEGGKQTLAAWYREEKIKETHGKCYKSVYNYARLPKWKRTPLGSKPGRPSQEADAWAWVNGSLQSQLRGRAAERQWWQLRRDREHQLQRQYQSPRNRALLRKYLRGRLPQICRLMGYGEGSTFLKEEIDLMDRCFDTFGSAMVSYQEPENGEDSDRRRAKLEAEIVEFQRVQTRHCLAAVHSASDINKLLVTLDYLLGKFDDKLERRGVERSSLQWRLREYQYLHKTDADREVEREAKEACDAALRRAGEVGVVPAIDPQTHRDAVVVTREEFRAEAEARRRRVERRVQNLR